MTRDLPALRKQLEEFLRRHGNDGEPIALLGGESLPDSVAFEAVVMAYPKRRVVHLDGTLSLDEEAVQQGLLKAFAKNHILLVTLTRKVGLEVFKPLEKFLAEGKLDVLKPWGWTTAEPSVDFRLIIHSRPGSFPFDDNVSLKFNLDTH